MFISSSYAANTSTTENQENGKRKHNRVKKTFSSPSSPKVWYMPPYACILHHYLLLTTSLQKHQAVSYRRLCPTKPAPKEQNDLTSHQSPPYHDHRYIYAISSLTQHYLHLHLAKTPGSFWIKGTNTMLVSDSAQCHAASHSPRCSQCCSHWLCSNSDARATA